MQARSIGEIPAAVSIVVAGFAGVGERKRRLISVGRVSEGPLTDVDRQVHAVGEVVVDGGDRPGLLAEARRLGIST